MQPCREPVNVHYNESEHLDYVRNDRQFSSFCQDPWRISITPS